MASLQVHGVVVLLESIEGRHLGLGELKVVHLSVLLDARRCYRLGKRDEALEAKKVSDAL
jgi:hypothetical protein